MKLKTLIMLLSLLVSTPLFADNERLRQNFDFDWKFSLSDDSKYAESSYNDKSWQDVQLPHDWNIAQDFVREQGGAVAYLPEGVAWYRKTFVMPTSSSNKNVLIMFDGIFMQSDVYINGNHLGYRPYGFCSLEYDLTPYLNEPGKENVIAVRVNTTGDRPRWYAGAGIYRHVWLSTVNPVHVKTYGTFVTTPEITESQASVNCATTIVNNSDQSQKVSVYYSILDSEGSVVAEVDGGQVEVAKDSEAEVSKALTLKNPKLWDVDSPNLYSLETVVKDQNTVVDRVVTSFGVRYFKFDPNNGFSLNGKHMKLKGLCLHQDAGSMGVAVPDRSYERRLEILKEYGCNAIRCSHNQPSPEFLEMCDRMGFLVIDEAFDKWKSGYYEKYFDDWWQADLNDMVMRDRNHPSIILWSIGNELLEAYDGANTGMERAAMLQDYVHTIDTTRPCTLAAQSGHQSKFSGVPDVAGYNYLEAKMISDHKTYPSRCFYLSEELPYYSGEEDNIRSFTNYNPWNYVEDNDFIAGGFIWSGVDYLGESGWPSKGWSNGLFDICMSEKPRAAYHRAKWNDTPLVSIAVLDDALDIDQGRDLWQWPNMASLWNFPDSYIGTDMEVRTITNCEQVEMFYEGESLGVKSTKDFVNNTIVWTIPYKPGKLEAKGYNNGVEVTNDVLVTAGDPTELKISVDRSKINSDGQDLSHISLQLVDKDGNPVQTDDKDISVVVEGEGRLKGLDNGDLRVSDSFAKESITTYFGKALITIQSTRTSGKINVKINVGDINKTYNVVITTEDSSSSDDEQAAETLRRPISPEQPAWLIHIDVWNYPDPQRIIDMVPEDVRPYVIFNLATSSGDEKNADGPSIYDSWMKVCAQNRVWTMIQCASGAKNRMPDDGSTDAYEQYFKDYPNFLGFNFAEQFWGFGTDGCPDFPTRLQLFADLMPVCHKYGGYLAVSFCDSYYDAARMPMAYLKRNDQMRQYLETDPEHFLCFEKYTLKKNFYDIESQCLGQWLAGYAGQYGIRFDRCGWLTASDDTETTRGASDFVCASGAIPLAEHLMLTGETIMDGPELSWRDCSQETAATTVDGYTRRNWGWFPQFKNITLDLFRKVLDGTIRIPTKQEVIDRTKVCLVNDINKNPNSESERNSYITPVNLYDNLYRSSADHGGSSNEWVANRWWLKTTGRYPAIPSTYKEVDGMTAFKKSKYDQATFDSWMQDNFPEEYTGDIYASHIENGWITYNPYQYDESTATDGYRVCAKSTQRAAGTIPFQYNTAESISLDYAPYSLGIMKEYSNKISLYLTNYEGGTDTIKINGATSRPSFSRDDRGNESSTITESWVDGVYTLTVTHSGGAVDLTISCKGKNSDRKTAPASQALTNAPTSPSLYEGQLQYEAEVADYKSAKVNKTGYNLGHDGYMGQGFAEMTSASSALRFSVKSNYDDYYLMTIRYDAAEAGSVEVDGESIPLPATTGWGTVQMLKYLKAGENYVVLQNGTDNAVCIDYIALDRVEAEVFNPSADGSFYVNLSKLMASGNISFDSSTGVVTQTADSKTGCLTLYFDHADFSTVNKLTVEYDGDGNIFKTLNITDNTGTSVNPDGVGNFWSSKYNLNYANYRNENASGSVCKLLWNANNPDGTRTMTIKNIVISADPGTGSVDNVESNDIVPVAIYNLQGMRVNKTGIGVYIILYSDGSTVKRYFKK